MRRQDSQQGEVACPVCLSAVTCPVDTNCNHTYCARCILTHWQHDRNHPHACHCPVCRRKVTLLMGSEEWNTSDNQQIFSEVANYNQQMSSEEFGLYSRLRDIPALCRHLWQDIFGGHSVVPLLSRLYIILVMLAAVAYFLSPFDLIPEMVFGIFGYIDDLIAVFFVLVHLAEQYRTHVANFGQRQR